MNSYNKLHIMLILLATIVIFFAYYFFKVMGTVNVSRSLIAESIPFAIESVDNSKTMLVLGDSTAAGVGAGSADTSLPALVAHEIGATHVENYAFSGALITDIPSELARSKLPTYDLILVQVGANDIIRFHSADKSAALLASELQALPQHKKLIVIVAGNVGGASAIPWFLKAYYTRLTLSYHASFAKAITEIGGTYVDLFTDPHQDPIVLEPKKYLAADGFHPSSLGYILWFEKMKAHLAL